MSIKRFKLKPPAPKEADEQAFIFDWARLMSPRWPELELLYAVPNGVPVHGPQKWAIINAFKRRGLKAGVPDIVLPCQRMVEGVHYAGLYLELKRRGGVLSAEQKWWLGRLCAEGYKAVSIFGAQAAIEELKRYVGALRPVQ